MSSIQHEIKREAAGALEEAGTALEEAAEEVLDSDDLLLKEEARQVAAQVSTEHPLGVPGKPLGERSPVRFGFATGIGLLLAAAVGALVVLAGHILVLLLIAALVAIGLEPVVAFLCRHGLSRGVAVGVVVVVGLALMAVFVIQVVPLITTEATQITHQLPRFLHDLQDKNSAFGRLILKYHLEQKAEKVVSVDAYGGVVQLGGVVLSVATSTVIVLVLVVYFLASFPLLKEVVYRLFPRSRRPRVGVIGDEILARIGGYALGNALTSIIAIIANYVLLRILGVPFALVLSVLVGLLDLVPLIGSIVGGAVVALIAFATVSLTAGLITIGFHLLYRALEDYFINPRVLRKTVNVRPVVTVVAVLLGGTLLGIVGALIAVPVAAAVQLILTEVVFPSQDNR
jgi:predicted PurR-regulated permease PerM